VNGQARTTKIIPYRQGPDLAPVEKLIGHNIQAPALVGSLKRAPLEPMGGGPAALGPFAA
jgi:hypothetical protein